MEIKTYKCDYCGNTLEPDTEGLTFYLQYTWSCDPTTYKKLLTNLCLSCQIKISSQLIKLTKALDVKG